jgi:hypothetical protein
MSAGDVPMLQHQVNLVLGEGGERYGPKQESRRGQNDYLPGRSIFHRKVSI